MEADYVIVGAGSAGCAMAYRLAEAGKSVLVVKHGGTDAGPFIQMPGALSYPMNMRRYDWGYRTEPEPHLNGRRLACPRGKVIGGSSSINGMVYVRGHALDYDHWRDQGCDGWGYADVLPYFKRSEDNARGANAYHGVGGPLRVEDPRTPNPLSLAFVDAAVQAGHDPRALIGRAAAVIFNQVFRDGFFHADLHPGNLFVAEDGALIAVDFGIMGRLDKETRRYLAEMLVGFLTSDYAYVAEVHFRAGYVPPTESKAAFAQACRSIGEPILGLPANEISFGRLIAQLFQVTEAFHMETQPHLLLLQKTMMVAEGVSRNLDPTINMWQLAQPLMERWVADILSPQTRVRDATHEIVDALQRLPQVVDNLDKAARSLARGNVQINVQNVDADIDALPRQPTNVLLAGIAAILILILLLQL